MKILRPTTTRLGVAFALTLLGSTSAQVPLKQLHKIFVEK